MSLVPRNYDNQTRSMLQTPQKYPRAGSQNDPSPAAEQAEGSTTVWFSPKQPDGVARGNWVQTDSEKGWVVQAGWSSCVSTARLKHFSISLGGHRRFNWSSRRQRLSRAGNESLLHGYD